MGFSLEQVLAYKTVVDAGGIKQAARVLGKHASTLREQVTNFELDTGLELFVRHPRSLEPTEAGRDLYKHACAVLREAEHLQNKVDSLLRGEPSRLTVAIDASLRSPSATAVLQRLQQQFPSLELMVLNDDTLRVRNWVQNGEADIALILGTVTYPDELMYSQAFPVEVVRVVPAAWGLGPKVDMHDLRARPQLSWSFLGEVGLASADLFSNQVTESNNAYQILQMVEAGMGFAHLPGAMCEEALARGEVMLVSLDMEDECVNNWHADVVWAADQPLDSARHFFLNAIRMG